MLVKDTIIKTFKWTLKHLGRKKNFPTLKSQFQLDGNVHRQWWLIEEFRLCFPPIAVQPWLFYKKSSFFWALIWRFKVQEVNLPPPRHNRVKWQCMPSLTLSWRGYFKHISMSNSHILNMDDITHSQATTSVLKVISIYRMDPRA